MTMRDEFEAWAETHALSEEARGYGMVQGAWQDAWAAATERAAKIVHDNAMQCDRVTREILLSNAAAIRGGERAA